MNMRPIPGLEGYFADEDGNIYSDVPTRRKKGLIKLKTPACTNGYLSFGVYVNRHRKNILVHRAVAMAWLDGPKEGQEVCHIDGNRIHNAVSNLRWDTRSGNHADKLKHGTHSRGERHGAAKLTSDQVEEIRRSFAARNRWEWGAATLARKFGVSEGVIHDVARGKSWSWVISGTQS